MDLNRLFSLLRRFSMPVTLIVLGVLLAINPNAASVLITKLLGWGLIAGAVLTGISAIFSEFGRIRKGIIAVALAVTGGWLCANPLALAVWAGRFAGAILIVNGLLDGFAARNQGRSILLQAVMVVMGLLLLVLPLTLSRLVFSVCAVIIAVIGVVMLLGRIRDPYGLNPPDEPEDPNIIDAL